METTFRPKLWILLKLWMLLKLISRFFLFLQIFFLALAEAKRMKRLYLMIKKNVVEIKIL